MEHPYSNFKNPLGLVKRMLLSQDRAAHSALSRAAFTLLLQPLDLLLEPVERLRLQAASASTLPIILIIGAPRSGTTLVYQVLARFLPVTYFSNWSALFPRSPLTASRLFEKMAAEKNFDYHSFYGNSAGLAAPNDGFHVWNRWLGADRYRAPQRLSADAGREMKRFFNAWLSVFNKPLLNKNNRNTDCIALLASILDNLHVISVRREPVYVAQSLLLARLQIQGDKAIGWGLHSRNRQSRQNQKDYLDDVCEQVLGIEAKLQADQQRLAPERFLEVSYEQFCRNPGACIQDVSQKILRQEVTVAALQRELKPFSSTNDIRLDRDEFERMQERMHQRRSCHATSQ